MRDFIAEQINEFEAIIRAIGGRWEQPIIDGPASERELAVIETDLGTPIPATLREFARVVSRRIYFDWSLPNDFALPESLNDLFGGGVDFAISSLPDHERGRAGWQRECFPNPEDSYDAVWHGKVGFHHVPNGDYLGIATDGQVVYLSHDDGEGHGRTMAPSFTDLLLKWMPLGCPGPEDWQWLPFVTDRRNGIDDKSKAAKTWLNLLHHQS